MNKYIQDEFVNRCSCRWQKDRFSGGSFFMTEDPEKIKKIENSPFFRNGTIKLAGEIPTEPVAEVEVAEVETVVEGVEEKEDTGKDLIDQGALDKALADIKAGKEEPEVEKTIEQKSQALGMQPKQQPRPVEWKEMTQLAKEKGIPTTGKGVNRPYLAKALSQHGIFVQ